ncbi:uncharacterized protein DS421_11g342650 [Arachis hypogaea]|nr:uncharacterized protein DS421_11g342650 [Arachis hypogaea]
MWMLCLVHNLLSFKRELKKMMLFKIFSRPIGMDKFKGTYPVRRVCEDAAIVGIFEFFGSDLSPDKTDFLPRGEGSFKGPSKVTKISNDVLTPSNCS